MATPYADQPKKLGKRGQRPRKQPSIHRQKILACVDARLGFAALNGARQITVSSIFANYWNFTIKFHKIWLILLIFAKTNPVCWRYKIWVSQNFLESSIFVKIVLRFCGIFKQPNTAKPASTAAITKSSGQYEQIFLRHKWLISSPISPHSLNKFKILPQIHQTQIYFHDSAAKRWFYKQHIYFSLCVCGKKRSANVAKVSLFGRFSVLLARQKTTLLIISAPSFAFTEF